jgi:Peptidase family M1 domain/Peptidase M1 N-terminal domain
MRRRTTVLLIAAIALLAGTVPAGGAEEKFTPGAPGLGDPYFPLDGNGGYDVGRYHLRLRYDPATDLLRGRATIRAAATQDLSAFNLDFEGLEIVSIKVNGAPAAWSRDGNELTVTPKKPIPDGRRFVTEVRYRGVPVTQPDGSGFMHTDDGAVVIGQPDVAASWFPVNDHPLDPAKYLTEISVPVGLEAVSNGILERKRTSGGRTNWVWRADDPMASYLAMMVVGELDIDRYRIGRLPTWDAIDPDLLVKPEPLTGEGFAYTQQADFAYKRLGRTIDVPPGGAELSFWTSYKIEEGWDYLFVEARVAGSEEWTTLPDLNGHASQDTGFTCPGWQEFHPFLLHYQNPNCEPVGTTGEWWAATGASDGYEQWTVDLSPYAGSQVEVSLTYATDFSVQDYGVVVDDIVVSTGVGSTSFEDDGDPMDGWAVLGAAEGSPGNINDWIVGGPEILAPTEGDIALGSLARQDEVIAFLEDIFGRYPFRAAGGVVPDSPDLFFALETQTRPIYSRYFFTDSISGDSVVVHEIAHQWTGDKLALAAWQHIWLNEGFASYAEWLWSEAEGLGTADEIFQSVYSIPDDDPFWSLTIGDPGPDNLFDIAVYFRGAMTLHALRMQIGDDAFFELLRTWTRRGPRNVSTDEFIALAERISGQELGDLFDAWLFTGSKPQVEAAATSGLTTEDAPDVLRSQMARIDRKDTFLGK